MSAYPPQPWRLRGQLHASAHLVPLTAVPFVAPPGWRPVCLGRRAVVGSAWVDYQPGGVLSYRELMTTILVRRGWRVRPSITHIWVDSGESLAGGRALWAIPKQSASFETDGVHWTAGEDGGPIATAEIRRRFGLPGRWPVRFSIVQTRASGALVSPVRVRARIALARVSMSPDPDGPLAFLAGRRAVISFTLGDFDMLFGRRLPG